MRASKRLIQAIVAFGASVVLCIGACAAWFVNNQFISSEGLEAQVSQNNIRDFSVTAYNLSINDAASEALNKTVYEVGEPNVDIQMSTYGDFSVDTAALLLKINCELSEISTDAYKVYIDGNDDVQNVRLYEEDDDYDFVCCLSDAICFYGVVYEGEELTVGSSLTFGDKTGFITISGMSVTKSDIILETALASSKVIYLVIDYDTANINKLYSNSLDIGGSLNSTMKFSNDIVFHIEKA